ncbi:hypothetical protein BDW74DRAFT_162581 [Aspergillus multicolor]|uniref:uncharacterized protein n=1 Tax=Aspergillus multicolor TaxID=41759 RepID=UPI003CCDA9C1
MQMSSRLSWTGSAVMNRVRAGWRLHLPPHLLLFLSMSCQGQTLIPRTIAAMAVAHEILHPPDPLVLKNTSSK